MALHTYKGISVYYGIPPEWMNTDRGTRAVKDGKTMETYELRGTLCVLSRDVSRNGIRNTCNECSYQVVVFDVS